jgi:hypothetical protein
VLARGSRRFDGTGVPLGSWPGESITVYKSGLSKIPFY